MRYYADLHIHSKYSRATSKQCDLEHLALWAGRKGISVVGTGDFTHPAWFEEIQSKLIEAEPGLFQLRPQVERQILRDDTTANRKSVRFLLQVEISTIYKKGDKTRKVHHLVFMPSLGAAARLIKSLEKIGNLKSDGRPILGLDSRHLLELTLEADEAAYLIPAHIWTPWFAALGSKSGFDAIEECYGDLSSHIFAVETGLSSDPPMNWKVSSLDRYRLVSNSDAHSPQKLGREACMFDTDRDYFALRMALETGDGYVGTVEFFPEEGKYHLDGHRKCQVRLHPGETVARDGACPVCGKPVTVGVMHRVHELADKDSATPPATAGEVSNLLALPELLGELHATGPGSKRVMKSYDELTRRVGPELFILRDAPLDEIRRHGSSLVSEAVERLRRGEVRCEAGYDGEYGVIRLFDPEELRDRTLGGTLFDVAPIAEPSAPPPPMPEVTRDRGDVTSHAAPPPEPPTDLLDGLDDDQRRAATTTDGALMIIAGPGSGKTRTLTHRIAHIVREKGIQPSACLAITFTRRAADEMRERLATLLPGGDPVTVHTFHSLSLAVLRENGGPAGVHRGFRVASLADQITALRESSSLTEREARAMLPRISKAKRRDDAEAVDDSLSAALSGYTHWLETHDQLDFDDLILRAAIVLREDAEYTARLQQRHPYVSVDEYQDIDRSQLALVRRIAPRDLCVIGDPDQAIYGFRGADVRGFHAFTDHYPGAHVIRLQRNYRSTPILVTASHQLLADETRPAPIPCGPAVESPPRVTIHTASTERAEAEFVVHAIERLLGGHSFFSIDTGRADGDVEPMELSFRDIAVLYRTEAQLPPLVEAFDRSGLPFQHRSHRALTDLPGVVTIVAALEKDALRDGQDVAHRLREIGEAGAGDVSSSDLAAAIDQLVPIARRCAGDIDRFVTEVSLATQVDTWDPRAQRIGLLTLHASKGLEFRAVFLVGCEDGIIPFSFAPNERKDPTRLEEERRLFYVGATRAMERLTLCHTRRRRWRGKVREAVRSPFLDALHRDLIVHSVSERRPTTDPSGGRQLELF